MHHLPAGETQLREGIAQSKDVVQYLQQTLLNISSAGDSIDLDVRRISGIYSHRGQDI